MWKFYVGAFALMVVVLGCCTLYQLQGVHPVQRAAYTPSAAPSKDDSAMSNMRIP